jgi:hypothetical protein
MRLTLSALVLLLAALPATAQEFGRIDEIKNTSQAYFVHAVPGEATIRVFVWGTVRLPGTYEVGTASNLGDVLSLAGGPLLTPLRQTDAIDVDRTISIRLYRLEGDRRIVLYEAPLDEMVAATEPYPVLREGDVIEVQTDEVETRRWTWRETLTIVGAVATSVIAVSQLVNVVR